MDRAAEFEEFARARQASLLRTFALVGTLALALAAAAGVLIATLIARPLRRMATVAAAVDSGDLSLRAGPVDARGEVGVLAAAFDHMLERLERAFARQRDFVSDASHELRTPLAVLRAQVELLAQAGCAEVFADVGEALFELKERAFDGLSVGVGDVAPHGEGACAEARHLAQSATADVFELRGVADLIF